MATSTTSTTSIGDVISLVCSRDALCRPVLLQEEPDFEAPADENARAVLTVVAALTAPAVAEPTTASVTIDHTSEWRMGNKQPVIVNIDCL